MPSSGRCETCWRRAPSLPSPRSSWKSLPSRWRKWPSRRSPRPKLPRRPPPRRSPSSRPLPPNPRWAENNPEYHHPAGHENEGNLHTNELKWARTIALPESLSPYYPLAEDKIRYAYERVSGGLSPADEALKLANDSIAYSIRKTVSSIPSLQERYRHDCELQQKIEQYKAEGKKIPATWIKNPFYQRYYREKNLLQE